jgi:hypothetical protein
MYHELLHKHLGWRGTNRRAVSHSTEFRKLERLFERYEKAKQVLERLSGE